MRPTRLILLTTAAVLAASPATVGPVHAAQDGPTCFGLEPTITGSGEVRGTRGDDVILATPGSEVHALAGDDRVCGAGLVHAGPGHDRVWYDGGGADVLLDGGGGVDRLFYLGGSRAELVGGRGDDHLRAGPGRQRVQGGRGNDDISLGRGHDWTNGGPGNDRIVGGAGTDTADGGRGDRDHCRQVEDAVRCER